jgi:hypothetical protein
MQTSIAKDLRSKKRAVSSVLAFTFAVLTFILGNTTSGFAFPAFARKYGLRCSACHVAWPVLNDFGWRFKDNGYQLMNDRDAPIWQVNAFWPATLRITPNWHRENTDKVAVDTSPFAATTAEAEITAHGFDLSGLDILTGGNAGEEYFLSVGSIFGQHRSFPPGIGLGATGQSAEKPLVEREVWQI